MLRGVRGQRHSERERHPNGEGPRSVGQGGQAGAGAGFDPRGGPDIDPPPGVPIQQAWIAGRIGIGFIGEDGAGLDPRGRRSTLCVPAAEPPGQLNLSSLTALEALDVEERPFIWDL